MSAGLFEIGAVARELGVAASTLRTWERRYRLVIPRRGARGQRLYDADQIVVLRRVLAQVRHGTSAGAAHAVALSRRPLRTCRLRLEPCSWAPKNARHAVDELLAGRRDERVAFDLRLAASELVNNAVLHGSGHEAIGLELRLFDDSAELRVQNKGPRLRIANLGNRRREGGRGLEIVDALSDGWSIETGPRGTRIAVRMSFQPTG